MRAKTIAIVAMLSMLGGSGASAAITDPASTIDGARGDVGGRRIAYVSTIVDRPDLADLRFGGEGHWFAQFDAGDPVTGAPTGDNARDELPGWVGAFNHTEHPADPGCTEPDALVRGCLPTYNFRTFSQDGPARSAGGFDGWATLQLPSRECGIAGAIVDPHTFVAPQQYPDPTGVLFPPGGDPQPNNNNTINRIQLQNGAPDSFFVGVVTDAMAGQHDTSRLEIRGNVGLVDHREEVVNSQVESSSAPGAPELVTNGVPDVHVFRVEGFRSGDYLKLRLRGKTSPAAFSGLLFDDSFDPASPAVRPGKGASKRSEKARANGQTKSEHCPT